MRKRKIKVTLVNSFCFIFFAMLLSSSSLVHAQDSKEKDKTEEKKNEKDSVENKKGKEYKELLKDAKTQDGLFKIHQVKGKYYFEIPINIVGKDILISSRVSKVSTPVNIVAGRMPREPIMISFDYDTIQKKVYLLQKSIEYLVDKDSEIYSSYQNNHIDAIWKSFKIEAFNEDSTSMVVNFDKLFLSNEKVFNPFVGSAGGAGGMLEFTGSLDSDKSKIVAIKPFADNIRIVSLMSYSISGMPYTVEMTRNILLLPEDKMRIRYSDERVGFFERERFAVAPYKGYEKKKIITRWRLEPKEGEESKYNRGERVEPKKPIVWYVDPAIPDDFKKYIKLGIEDWQEAFEEIGFKNAIIARDYPTKDEDPDFDPDDIKYNCYRYATTFQENSMGPSWIDPRTGEIICGDVYFYSNVISLLKEWRFIQTAQVDARVRTPRYNNKLIGESLRYVAAHEIGHTLGLMHNFVSSYSYPVDSLRSPKFTHEYGTTASIMDYARYNYVAQPEDKNLYLLPPKLGLYDKFAIKYGYKLISQAESAEEEQKVLNDWLLEHKDDSMYTYLNPYTHRTRNPASQTEAIGDDAIKAGEYGIENLKYITEKLPDWMLEENKDYKLLQKYYNAIGKQFKAYMLHALNYLGGEYVRPTVYGDGIKPHRFVSKKKQKEALNFIFKQLEDYPAWYSDEKVTKHLWPQSYRNAYYRYKIFSILFSEPVAHGILQAELGNEPGCYTYLEYHNDIFEKVWGKTKKMDNHTMLLQNAYVNELLKGMKETKVEKSASYFKEEASSYGQHLCSHGCLHGGHDNISFSQTAINPRQAPIVGRMAFKTYNLLKKLKGRGGEKTKGHYQTLYLKLKFVLDE